MSPEGQPAWYPVWIDSDALDHYSRSLGLAGPEEGLPALARAVAASLGSFSQVRFLVARLAPQPLLAVWGSFDEVEEAWLQAQARHLNHASANLRYVSYSQVHEDCELLASKLLEHMGQEALFRARFTAIPRGGIVVLGLLAIFLGLEQEQLEGPFSADESLVVVDDCALTGSRFGQFLERHENRHLVFAPLYSHPGLRKAVEREESRVAMCLSARDLTEREAASLSPEQKQRWLARIRGRRYWLGHVERLCFPWNEPSSMIGDGLGECLHVAWHIVPPERCFRNRPPLDAPSVPIYTQPVGKGPIRPSPGLVFVQAEERIHLADLERKTSFVIDGVGVGIWRAILRHGELESVIRALHREFEVGEATLRRDVQLFVEDLLARGFLEKIA